MTRTRRSPRELERAVDDLEAAVAAAGRLEGIIVRTADGRYVQDGLEIDPADYGPADVGDVRVVPLSTPWMHVIDADTLEVTALVHDDGRVYDPETGEIVATSTDGLEATTAADHDHTPDPNP